MELLWHSWQNRGEEIAEDSGTGVGAKTCQSCFYVPLKLLTCHAVSVPCKHALCAVRLTSVIFVVVIFLKMKRLWKCSVLSGKKDCNLWFC